MIRCRECGQLIVDGASSPSEEDAAESREQAVTSALLASLPSVEPERETQIELDDEDDLFDEDTVPEPAADDVPPAAEGPESATRRRFSGRHAAYAAAVLAVAGLAAFLLFGPKRRPAEFRKALSAPEERLACVLFLDRERVAAGSASGNVFMWDVKSGKRWRLKHLTNRPILCLALSPDGFLSAGEEGGTLAGWQLGSKEAYVIPNFPAAVNAIAIRAPAKQKFELAVGLADGVLVFRGMQAAHFESGHTRVKEILFDPLSQYFVSAGSEGGVAWWDISSHKLLKSVKAHEAEIGGLAISADGKLVASGDWNGKIRLWDPDQMRPIAALSQPDAVSGMAFVGEALVTGSWDGRLRFFSTTKKVLLAEIDTGSPIAALAVSTDGRHLATVSGGQSVEIWRNPLR
jgi:WD40 repeat protein